MQVTLLIAKEISRSSGGWNINGIYNQYTFATFPATVTIKGLLIFDLVPGEYDSPVDFELQLKDAVGNLLKSSGREVKFDVTPKIPRLRDYNAVEFRDTTFEKPGWYYFSVLASGEEKSRVPLLVGGGA